MAPQHSSSRTLRRTAISIVSLASIAALTACSSGAGGGGTSDKYGFPAVEQDAKATIEVWVDTAREPAAQAFQSANPDIPIKITTYDGGANGSGTFQTKISLLDQSGEGWPDVVWSTQQNDSSWASQEQSGQQAFAAVLNKGLVSQDVLDGFAEGALSPATVDGNVYGLRNDLAQDVVWYDQSLFDQFGYTVPTTWEEYQEIGEKVATEHPGYIVGSVGDPWAPEVFFWGAKAPINEVTGVDTVKVDTSDEHTKKMAALIDDLISAGSMSQDSVFGADFVTKYTGKVLMLPGPSWYSGAIFQNPDNLNAAAGTIGAGLPLAWDGEDPVAGNVGGGIWYVSSHSKNLEAAAKFAEFVTTSDDYQVELAPGYPAYSTAAEAWLEKQASSGYFVGNFTENMITAASQVWDGWGYPAFSQEAIWAKAITPELASGTSLVSLLPAWQTAIENEAQVNGYTVSK